MSNIFKCPICHKQIEESERMEQVHFECMQDLRSRTVNKKDSDKLEKLFARVIWGIDGSSISSNDLMPFGQIRILEEIMDILRITFNVHNDSDGILTIDNLIKDE